MARTKPVQTALNAGEQSPNMSARSDLVVYANGGLWLQNFKALVPGAATFREGSVFVWNTRDNAVCRLIPFEYNDEQSYDLAFTDSIMRIVKDGGIVTETPQAITDITQASPPVVTYDGADNYSDGDRIVLSGVVGMSQVNNREFEVDNVDTGANTFELKGIDSTTYDAYVSGGTAAVIVEIATPYDAVEMWDVRVAQTFDTMYLVHPDFAPRKLTRSSHTAWALTEATIMNSPFGTTKAAAQNISGITKANPAVVTYSGSDTYANGDTVFINGVVGMTEVNGRNFTVSGVDTGANKFQLSGIDSTDYAAYSSGGTIEEYTEFSYPSVVAFYEERLVYAASTSFPQRLFASKTAVTSADYDNFDLGTELADEAFIYNISNGKGNKIRWMVGTEEFLAIGTSGGEFRASGGNDPMTPTSISVKPPSYYGSANVEPISLDSHILYIQRDRRTARTFEYDALSDGYGSVNRNLTSDHILVGRYGCDDGVKCMDFQQNNPNVNWMVRKDGMLVGLTFEPKEQVSGWHRHRFGGTYDDGKNGVPDVESVSCTSRPDAADRATFVVARTIEGETRRYIEYFAENPPAPRIEDYYTGKNSKAADKLEFLRDMWECQKRQHHVDCGLVYDGTVDQTLSIGGGTATAGGAVFSATDVGRQIWGKAGGRAEITAYTSSTVVTVDVTEAFPATSLVSGGWYLTASTFSGLDHLEGQEVYGVVDGGSKSFGSVYKGRVTTEQQHSYVIIGLKYTGIFKSMDISPQSKRGTGTAERKNMGAAHIFVRDTLGIEVGTSLYDRVSVPFRDSSDKVGRPSPLYTGPKIVKVESSWEDEKHLYIVQEQPLPATILMVKPDIEVNDG